MTTLNLCVGCKQVSAIEQTAFHFSLDSNLLHKESDEAQRQIARQEGGGDSSGEESGAEDGEGEVAEEGGEEEAEQAKKKVAGGEKRLRNQFNFSERASQTLNNPFRVSLMVWWLLIIIMICCRNEALQLNHLQELTSLPQLIK